ncbi:MAG: GTPase HflX [Spirochaetaceae bacterium]
MKELFSHSEDTLPAESGRVLLVIIKPPELSHSQAELYLEELKNLADTLGFTTADSMVVPVKKISPKYLVGSGKAVEIQHLAEAHEVECVVFDDTISPAQQRNWEQLTDRCVIDRQEVILEIFSRRARTREAILQVALARMEYSLPRLTRAWTHLSRQRGGTRGTRGEGETQLENDRRVVLKKITKLKRELAKLESQREVRRKQRMGVPLPTGAIVGYTNAGKSSLLNTLTDASVTVGNRLFATLDPSTKKMALPGGAEILLTDTVGFIRKLPHDLVDAFHSTLEEAVLADFLVHVVDASNSEALHHIETTKEVLAELGVIDTPTLYVFNKIDLCKDTYHLESLRKDYPEALFISLKTGAGLENFSKAVEKLAFRGDKTSLFRLPLSRYDIAAFLHRGGSVISERYDGSVVEIKAKVSKKIRGLLQEFLVE